MTFFENQIRARRKTKVLVLYFLLAVIGIIGALYLLALGVLFQGSDRAANEGAVFWYPELFGVITAVTLAIITLGSLFKILQLRGGGSRVAESLGGELVDPSTTDPIERKVLNVVEEMAIASGVAVPPVYILPEQAINAFAAGYQLDDAVIGVTRGCIEILTRNELQGVIAHEFSHIFHGDMRINIRLMGLLHGILIIAMIGSSLLRGSSYRRYGGHRSHSSSNSKDRGATLAIGLGLLVIGYIGVFFGKLIKAAISRQREFLADASAVQFTRDPEGISGALKKIGGFVSGSKLTHPNAEEMSHMYFANGISSFLGKALATHPPLTERIQRIDPRFNGVFEVIDEGYLIQESDSGGSEVTSGFASGDSTRVVDPESVIHQVGTSTPEHLSFAKELLHSIPLKLSQELHSSFGARALVYASLLDAREDVLNKQLTFLQANESDKLYPLILSYRDLIQKLGPTCRLPLIDLAVPALRQLSKAQYAQFEEHVRELVLADESLSLFEYTLHHILRRHARVVSQENSAGGNSSGKALSQQAHQATALIAMLANVGHDSSEQREQAFQAGLAELRLKGKHDYSASDSELTLEKLDEALSSLRSASERVKERVLRAAVAAVSSDQIITVEEAETVRAVGDALGCPIPPLFPTVGSCEIQ